MSVIGQNLKNRGETPDNDPVQFVLTNLERRPRSYFLDNLDLFWSSGFGVIGLTRPFIRVNYCIYDYIRKKLFFLVTLP